MAKNRMFSFGSAGKGKSLFKSKSFSFGFKQNGFKPKIGGLTSFGPKNLIGGLTSFSPKKPRLSFNINPPPITIKPNFNFGPPKTKSVSFIPRPVIFKIGKPGRPQTDRDLKWIQVKKKYPHLHPFSDSDKDGVRNWLDSYPLDSKRHSVAGPGTGRSGVTGKKLKKLKIITPEEKEFKKAGGLSEMEILREEKKEVERLRSGLTVPEPGDWGFPIAAKQERLRQIGRGELPGLTLKGEKLGYAGAGGGVQSILHPSGETIAKIKTGEMIPGQRSRVTASIGRVIGSELKEEVSPGRFVKPKKGQKTIAIERAVIPEFQVEGGIMMKNVPVIEAHEKAQRLSGGLLGIFRKPRKPRTYTAYPIAVQEKIEAIEKQINIYGGLKPKSQKDKFLTAAKIEYKKGQLKVLKEGGGYQQKIFEVAPTKIKSKTSKEEKEKFIPLRVRGGEIKVLKIAEERGQLPLGLGKRKRIELGKSLAAEKTQRSALFKDIKKKVEKGKPLTETEIDIYRHTSKTIPGFGEKSWFMATSVGTRATKISEKPGGFPRVSVRKLGDITSTLNGAAKIATITTEKAPVTYTKGRAPTIDETYSQKAVLVQVSKAEGKRLGLLHTKKGQKLKKGQIHATYTGVGWSVARKHLPKLKKKRFKKEIRSKDLVETKYVPLAAETVKTETVDKIEIQGIKKAKPETPKIFTFKGLGAVSGKAVSVEPKGKLMAGHQVTTYLKEYAQPKGVEAIATQKFKEREEKRGYILLGAKGQKDIEKEGWAKVGVPISSVIQEEDEAQRLKKAGVVTADESVGKEAWRTTAFAKMTKGQKATARADYTTRYQRYKMAAVPRIAGEKLLKDEKWVMIQKITSKKIEIKDPKTGKTMINPTTGEPKTRTIKIKGTEAVHISEIPDTKLLGGRKIGFAAMKAAERGRRVVKEARGFEQRLRKYTPAAPTKLVEKERARKRLVVGTLGLLGLIPEETERKFVRARKGEGMRGRVKVRRPRGRPTGSYKYSIPGKGPVHVYDYRRWARRQRALKRLQREPEYEDFEGDRVITELQEREEFEPSQQEGQYPQERFAEDRGEYKAIQEDRGEMKAGETTVRESSILSAAPIMERDRGRSSILSAANVFNPEERARLPPMRNPVQDVDTVHKPVVNPEGDYYTDVDPLSGKPILQRRIRERWAEGG